MLLPAFVLLNVGFLIGGAVVVDRVAVIVGRRVVKASDIYRDVRLSQFLNRQAIDLSVDARKKAAERLIDQELIRQEIMSGGYNQPSEQDVNAFFQQLRRDRFGGSDAQLRAALSQYGLSEEQLRQYLLWQLSVLRFIDQRFRPGVLVTDEDVRAYYDEHRTELQKANPQNGSLETLDPKIRETIAGERENRSFDEWLDQTRSRTRIEYREAAFGEVRTEGVRQ